MNRRALLGLLATAPLGAAAAASPADAATPIRPAAGSAACGDGLPGSDRYCSSTALYADSALIEGTDYNRVFRRHEAGGMGPASRVAWPRTVILAPHGGSIEAGTSELCLGVAGYHPGTLASIDGGPAHDYWMFEGIRKAGDNSDLHVTSTHCDDPVALALCAVALNAVGLHGCSEADAKQEAGTALTLVGGLNRDLKQALIDKLREAGFAVADAEPFTDLNGDHRQNIANRTRLGVGAQLEITKPQREALFGPRAFSLDKRRHNTNDLFLKYVSAVRAAISSIEARQPAGSFDHRQ